MKASHFDHDIKKALVVIFYTNTVDEIDETDIDSKSNIDNKLM